MNGRRFFDAMIDGDPSIPRPPAGPIPWMVWPKDSPDEYGRIVIYAQLWSEAQAEGCRRLGVPYVDGRHATEREAQLEREADAARRGAS